VYDPPVIYDPPRSLHGEVPDDRPLVRADVPGLPLIPQPDQLELGECLNVPANLPGTLPRVRGQQVMAGVGPAASGVGVIG
jgi:hypothetical protein